MANTAYDAFIARKNDFVQKIKTEEQRLKRQGKWVAKTPATEEEEEEEGDLHLSEGQPSKEEEEEEEMQVIPSEDIKDVLNEDVPGSDVYDERDQRANNSMHIKDLLKRNPTLKMISEGF